MNNGLNYILILVCIYLIISIVFYFICKKYNKASPFDDIGTIWIMLLLLYSVAPALSYYFQDGVYPTFLSGRLYSLQPSIETTAGQMGIAIWLALGFILIYGLLRSRIKPFRHNEKNIMPVNILISAGLLFIMAKLGIWVIHNVGIIGKAETYIEQYKMLNNAPSYIRQIHKLFDSGGKICYYVLLAGLFQRWPSTKYLIYLLIIFSIVFYDPSGSREGIAMELLAVLISWNIYVKRIKPIIFALVAITGLLTFTIIGTLRNIEDPSSYEVEDSFKGLGEFEAVWANGIEMSQLKALDKLKIPNNIRFGEFIQFVPGELLPFEKLSLSNWYVKEYYPEFKAQGGGWAFGTLAQSALGGGVFEAFLRGVFLAFFYIAVFGLFRNHGKLWWSYPLYLIIFLSSYRSIRDTTFTQITDIIQGIIPYLMLIWVVSLFFQMRNKKILINPK